MRLKSLKTGIVLLAVWCEQARIRLEKRINRHSWDWNQIWDCWSMRGETRNLRPKRINTHETENWLIEISPAVLPDNRRTDSNQPCWKQAWTGLKAWNLRTESCRGWDSEHKYRILAKNFPDELASYQRKVQFQTHRCDTIQRSILYYIRIEKINHSSAFQSTVTWLIWFLTAMKLKSPFSTLLKHEIGNKKSSAWLMGDQARDENKHETEIWI